MRVRVADGATFRYLPHELIPFAGARYRDASRRVWQELDLAALAGDEAFLAIAG